MSRKFGIDPSNESPVSGLSNGEGDDGRETGEETCEKPFWGRWKRGFGFALGEDEAVEEAVQKMAEKLGLTEEEIEDVTPIGPLATLEACMP